MTPSQRALDIMSKINGQTLTLKIWNEASHYAKKDLKRKAFIVVDEVIEVLRNTVYYKQETYNYWITVRLEIETL